ncbi:MAG: hypothetical protein HZB26_13540 [Candidatus Hydrogenedentes bacterium]|nr:hypothetical protein [Candidatus Hydrogenedentota bacterium]
MLFAEKMDRISVLVLREDADTVFAAIAEAGLLHPARVEEIDAWAGQLEALEAPDSENEYGKRRQRIEQLLDKLGREHQRPVREEVREIRPATLDESDAVIARIEAGVTPLFLERESSESRREALKTALAQLDSFRAIGAPVTLFARSPFLVSVVGTVDEGQLKRLESLLALGPTVMIPLRKEGAAVTLVCVALRRDQSLLEQSLKAAGFRELTFPSELIDAASGDDSALRAEIARIEAELTVAAKKIEEARTTALPELMDALQHIEAAAAISRIKSVCRVTGASCLFTGWLPRAKSVELVVAVKKCAAGRAVVDVVAAEEVAREHGIEIDVPVLFRNPRFLEPFEPLLENYGVPAYRTIDPTLFASVAFLAMFGMMFGDLGHGAVLAAAGIFLAVKYPAFRNAGRLITYCGASASVFGVLFGSVFGFETLLRALWIRPTENIETLFTAAIGFGVTLLSLGILLGIVNAVRTHTLAKRFFEPSGPLGAAAYWLGVGIAIKLVSPSLEFSHLNAALWVFAALLLSFFLKGPVLRLLGKEERVFPEGMLMYGMEGTIEIAEFVMGYLANTVSFIRVAAFGLAHAGLLVAVFSVSDIVSHAPAGGLMSVVVLVAGNALVIVFEGVVATIQVLRLEYYEFFGKFFNESGVKYKPVRYADVIGEYRS